MTSDDQTGDIISELLAQPETNGDWGPWQLLTGNKHRPFGALKHVTLEYEIDLGGCRTSAEVLDWIMQTAGKGWADNATLAGLVRAFDDILYPQETLCSDGQPKTLSEDELRKRIAAAAARPTERPSS